MDEHAPKMHALKKIIEAMTSLQHGGLKKKGAPVAASMTIEAKDPAALAAAGEHSPEAHDADDSHDVLQQLMEHYSKPDDDEDDDDFKKAKQPVQIAGTN